VRAIADHAGHGSAVRVLALAGPIRLERQAMTSACDLFREPRPLGTSRRDRLALGVEQVARPKAMRPLLRLLSGDCPKRNSLSAYDLCGIHCPELPAFFGGSPRS
jgi:hypothetical protein